MNITVLDADGLPPKAYLSVRVGDTRRQAPFKKNEVFHFPSVSHRSLVLDVFEKMGSQHVHLNTFEDVWGEHEIVLKTPHLDRESIKVNLKLETTDPTVEKKPSRHQVATKARNYLENHSVQDFLQEMVHALLARRPDDPLDFMAEYIRGQQVKRSAQVPTQQGEPASTPAPPARKPPNRDPNSCDGDDVQKSLPRQRVSVSETTNRQSGKRLSSSMSDPYSLPGLGESEYPGFPTDACPDVMPDLTAHFSFMADVLAKTPSIYDKLKNRRTKSGVNLAKVIKPGIDNKGHAMIKTTGVIAGDEETYTLFSDLLDPIINMRHGGFAEDARHSTDLDFSKVDVAPVDPTGKHVLSTRMRASRNIRGFRFPSACSKDERREVERIATQALLELAGDFTGDYFPLHGSHSYPSRPHGMNADESSRLEEAKMTFQEPDSALLLSTGMGRHWPDARGVFANDQLDFVVWLNEEDHMNFHLVQKGASAVDVFTRFCHVHTVVESGLRQQGLDFMHHDRLGFLTSCVSNIGSSLRISMSIMLPVLSSREDFKDVCRSLQLIARSVSVEGRVWEVSNLERLGTSDVGLVNIVSRGCRQLVAMECALRKRLPVPRPGLGGTPTFGFPTPCPDECPELSGHNNLMSRVFRANPALYHDLKRRTTIHGLTLAHAMKPGVDMRGGTFKELLPLGLVAGDAESYTVFAQVFDPVLAAYHGSKPGPPQHCVLDPGAVVGDLGDFVIGVKLCASRNLAGFRFPPACSFDERREVERVLVGILEEFTGGFEGEYYPLQHSESCGLKLGGMTQSDARTLKAQGLLFHEPKTLSSLAAGFGRDWPDARGVFASSRGLSAWVNNEEHLSLTISKDGSDLRAAFGELCRAEQAISLALQSCGHQFAWCERSGFVTAMPERLGAALSCCVMMQLPNLAARAELSDECESRGLVLVNTHRGGVVEVANRATLGISEAKLVSNMIVECATLARKEADIS